MLKMSLHTVAHCTNNGDGSVSVRMYNNREELETDLTNSGFGYTVADIESGEDSYEYGTLHERTIELEVDPMSGIARLASSTSMSFGD